MDRPYQPDTYPEAISEPTQVPIGAYRNGYLWTHPTTAGLEAVGHNEIGKEYTTRGYTDTAKEVPQVAGLEIAPVLVGNGGTVAAPPGVTSPAVATPRWKRRRIWIPAVAFVLAAVIAIVVGCAVGLRSGRSNDASSPTP